MGARTLSQSERGASGQGAPYMRVNRSRRSHVYAIPTIGLACRCDRNRIPRSERQIDDLLGNGYVPHDYQRQARQLRYGTDSTVVVLKDNASTVGSTSPDNGAVTYDITSGASISGTLVDSGTLVVSGDGDLDVHRPVRALSRSMTRRPWSSTPRMQVRRRSLGPSTGPRGARSGSTAARPDRSRW
jgi:hypothetical protein